MNDPSVAVKFARSMLSYCNMIIKLMESNQIRKFKAEEVSSIRMFLDLVAAKSISSYSSLHKLSTEESKSFNEIMKSLMKDPNTRQLFDTLQLLEKGI